MTLRSATSFYLAAWLVHTIDHARRGLDATGAAVVWAGTIVGLVTAVMATLVLTRHPAAPFVATNTGLGVAAGVAASHLVPRWGPLSDALPGGDVDWFTWVAVLGEVSTAMVLGLVGLRILRQHQFSTNITTWR